MRDELEKLWRATERQKVAFDLLDEGEQAALALEAAARGERPDRASVGARERVQIGFELLSEAQRMFLEAEQQVLERLGKHDTAEALGRMVEQASVDQLAARGVRAHVPLHQCGYAKVRERLEELAGLSVEALGGLRDHLGRVATFPLEHDPSGQAAEQALRLTAQLLDALASAQDQLRERGG